MAQLVARLVRNEKVASSILARSTHLPVVLRTRRVLVSEHGVFSAQRVGHG